MTNTDVSPSSRTLFGLDALNFFLADVRDGLGPYLAIDLTSRKHWSPDRVGIAMAAMLAGPAAGIGAALSNVLTGWIVQAAGFNAGFLTLSAIAGAACLFYAPAVTG